MNIKITQIKSGIDRPERQKRTLQALGLRKLNSYREVEATPQILGMISKVNHLVKVENVDSNSIQLTTNETSVSVKKKVDVIDVDTSSEVTEKEAIIIQPTTIIQESIVVPVEEVSVTSASIDDESSVSEIVDIVENSEVAEDATEETQVSDDNTQDSSGEAD